MNKVILIGRLTKDAEIKAVGETTVARFTLAVDRKYKKDGEQTADFIGCQAWGKTADFIGKYCKKGTKLVVDGRIQTGSYTDKDGKKVFTTDVVAENVEFAESKASGSKAETTEVESGYVEVASEVSEELPFR